MISLSGKPQSIKSKCLRKTWTHYLADYISILSMKVTHFENLQIINISALNLFALTEKARIKSRVKIKKGTGRD